MNQVRERWLDADDAPARTTTISALAKPDALINIRLTAAALPTETASPAEVRLRDVVDRCRCEPASRLSMSTTSDIVIIGGGLVGASIVYGLTRLGAQVCVLDESDTAFRAARGNFGLIRVQTKRLGMPEYTAWSKRSADAWPDFAEALGSDAGIDVALSRRGGLSVALSENELAGKIAKMRRLHDPPDGAIEKPFPVRGWTLPGVMTAGAAQIALRSSGQVPAGRVAVAGSGPLMYLLALQLADAGADIVAVIETTPRANWLRAARYGPGFLASSYLGGGLRLLHRVRRTLRLISGATGLLIEGGDRARRIVVERRSWSLSIDCDIVLLHQGVIPETNIGNAMGLAQTFDIEQHCWRPALDRWFILRLSGASVAGDAGGITGAESAALRGAIAALEACRRLGRVSAEPRNREAEPLRRKLAREIRRRRFLDLLYRPAHASSAPADGEIIACRCEEVTIGQMRETTRALGVVGPNQLKTFLRCGMGPCQGRLCGPSVAEVMSEVHGVPMRENGYFRLLPPFRPLTVSEIASLPKTEAAVKAVVR